LNFERFRLGRLCYTPGIVKLWESTGRAGGLLIIINFGTADCEFVEEMCIIRLSEFNGVNRADEVPQETFRYGMGL
jgi:hypothetical protein